MSKFAISKRFVVGSSSDVDQLFTWTRAKLSRGQLRMLVFARNGHHSIMLARRLHALVRKPTTRDQKVLLGLYGGAGILRDDREYEIAAPPFRAPHYTVSTAGMLGLATGKGDAARVRPGEVSLAHAGTLLLDEVDEFARNALEQTGEAITKGHVDFQMPGTTTVVEVPSKPKLVVGTVKLPAILSPPTQDESAMQLRLIENALKRTGHLEWQADVWLDLDLNVEASRYLCALPIGSPVLRDLSDLR